MAFAFHAGASYEVLEQRRVEGWTVQATRLSEQFGWDDLRAGLGTPLDQWILLGAITPRASSGSTRRSRRSLAAGWTAIHFAPGRTREA